MEERFADRTIEGGWGEAERREEDQSLVCRRTFAGDNCRCCEAAELGDIAPFDGEKMWSARGCVHPKLLERECGPESGDDDGEGENPAGRSPLAMEAQLTLADEQGLAGEQSKPGDGDHGVDVHC